MIASELAKKYQELNILLTGRLERSLRLEVILVHNRLNTANVFQREVQHSFTPCDDKNVNSIDIDQHHQALDHSLDPVHLDMGETEEEKAPASSFYDHDISLNFTKADLARKEPHA